MYIYTRNIYMCVYIYIFLNTTYLIILFSGFKMSQNSNPLIQIRWLPWEKGWDDWTGNKFSNLFCPIPTQPILHMGQHVADWVALFPRSQDFSPPPLKFFHTPPTPTSTPSLPYVRDSQGQSSSSSRTVWTLSSEQMDIKFKI